MTLGNWRLVRAADGADEVHLCNHSQTSVLRLDPWGARLVGGSEDGTRLGSVGSADRTPPPTPRVAAAPHAGGGTVGAWSFVGTPPLSCAELSGGSAAAAAAAHRSSRWCPPSASSSAPTTAA